ncbi:MAG: SRPBCC family protein [Myxococcota bacterium]
MHEIRATTDITAPIDRVWTYIADHERFLTGGPELRCTLVTEGTDERNGLGAVRLVESGPLTFREEITAFDSGHRYEYVIRELTGPMKVRMPVTHRLGWVELTDAGDHTSVVWSSRFRVDLFFVAGMVERQLGKELQHAFDGLLERARRVIEAS